MELVNRMRGVVARGDVSDRSIRPRRPAINGSNADSVTLKFTSHAAGTFREH